MMGLTKNLVSGMGIAILCASGLVSASEIERTEWSPVPGASHYVGTLEENGNTYKIVTPSTWILTGKGTVKKIDAWSGRGPLRRDIDRSATPLSDIVPLEQTQEPAREEEPVREDTAMDPEPTPEEPAVDPTPEQQEPVADEPADAAPEIVPEPDTTTFTTWSRAGVSIGMGKQWLTSEVGISDFAGSANIGGTILSGMFGSADSAMWYEGEISAHNFTTETAKSDATSSSTKEERNAQTRVRIMAFYNFFQRVSNAPQPMTGLAAGAGIQYLSHPLLVIDNAQTGAAVIKTKTATALNLGVRYGSMLTLRNLLVSGLNLAPVNVSGDVKTMSTNVFVEWLHLITPRVFTNLGVTAGRESITHEDKCPAVTNCKSNGTTGSDLLQIRMGLAVGF